MSDQTTRLSSRPFIISRVFNAPRDLVWKCFTDPHHMQQWWGPKGVTIAKSEMDFRVGGTYHYAMQPGSGPLMWGRMVFREISPKDRIVFVNSFSDEAGGLTRHPMAPSWPIELLSVFTFEDHPGGQTKFTVQWTPLNPTEEERASFDSGHGSMTMGWTGTLDKLETYVATVN